MIMKALRVSMEEQRQRQEEEAMRVQQESIQEMQQGQQGSLIMNSGCALCMCMLPINKEWPTHTATYKYMYMYRKLRIISPLPCSELMYNVWGIVRGLIIRSIWYRIIRIISLSPWAISLTSARNREVGL